MSSKRPTLIALVCFFLALASREVMRHLPPAIAEPAWKLGWVLLCFAGLWVAHRMGPRAALAELGLTGSAVKGLGIALLASLPMLVMLLLISKNPIRVVPRTMFSGVMMAAVTEEILFRGYLFGQLYRRAGWRFVPAVLVTGILFGLAHMGTALRGGALEVLGVTGITTLGGAFFAWLFVRWNYNLWVPIGMHLFLNAWWELFGVSQNAIGNWESNVARALAIVAAIRITLLFTKAANDRTPTW
ncbi:MAG: CPBP family intramembrane glutamic endopeptidase [Chthoniobacterales bacterium]